MPSRRAGRRCGASATPTARPTRRSGPKFYCLDFFPYPSGDGLSVGHCRNYVPTDVDLALQAHERLQRAAPDGLGRLRPAGRELRHQDGRAAARHHRTQHRHLPPADGPDLALLRLEPRDRELQPRLLQVDAVVLPADVRARSGLPGHRPQWWCPVDKTILANEQVENGPLLALRQRGDQGRSRAVVLRYHRVCAAAARRPGDDRLAREDQADAGELDRPQRGRRGRFRPGRPRRRARRCSRRGRTRSSAPRTWCWRPSIRWSRS